MSIRYWRIKIIIVGEKNYQFYALFVIYYFNKLHVENNNVSKWNHKNDYLKKEILVTNINK